MNRSGRINIKKSYAKREGREKNGRYRRIDNPRKEGHTDRKKLGRTKIVIKKIRAGITRTRKISKRRMKKDVSWGIRRGRTKRNKKKVRAKSDAVSKKRRIKIKQ
jgi:hypothetical protein